MNTYRNPYQHTQVTTASPEQILIMLYDGAIRFVVQANAAIVKGDRAKKIECIDRAMAIVMYLSETLDHEVGGKIAEDLDALYYYMIKGLTNANMKDDVRSLEVVEGLLRDLHETWIKAVEIARKQSAEAADLETVVTPNDYKPLSMSL